jgi:hypothetical protein
MDWIDRVLGRAAVDPPYRQLLLSSPALALTGEPLPAGLMAAVCSIRAANLREFAERALSAQAQNAQTASRRARQADPAPAFDSFIGAAA